MKHIETKKGFFDHASELIEDQSLAIFAGAGISFRSGVPTVHLLMDKILRVLGANKLEPKIFQYLLENASQNEAEELWKLLQAHKIINADGVLIEEDLGKIAWTLEDHFPVSEVHKARVFRIFHDYVATAIQAIKESDLPFESFIETVIADRDPRALFDIFSLGEPNTNHLLIAELAAKEKLKIICTTNFDPLIEKAIQQQGLNLGKDFVVLSQEDDFAHIDPHDGRLLLLKIHGSVDNYESLAITLRKVAHRELSLKRKAATDHVFASGSHTAVLVLGYSCSDIFDISPQIESIQEGHKEILFLDHRSPGEFQTEPVGEKEDKNPFKAFPGIRIYANTDEVVREIWRAVLPDKEYSLDPEQLPETGWEESVDKLRTEISDEERPQFSAFVMALLFDKLSQHTRALHYEANALMGLHDRTDLPAIRSQVILTANMGITLAKIGNKEQAQQHLIDAVRLAKKHELYAEGLEASKALGSLLAENEVPEKVGGYYDHMRELNERYKENEGGVLFLHNHAHAKMRTGQHDEARQMLLQAIRSAAGAGWVKDEASCTETLGILEREQGNFEQAVEHYFRSLNLFIKIGDTGKEDKLRGNLAIAFKELHEYEKSYEQDMLATLAALKFDKKFSISLHLGTAIMTAYTFFDIDLEHCITGMAMAYKVHELSDQKDNIHAPLYFLLGVAQQQRRFRSALRYIEEIIKVSEQLALNNAPLSNLYKDRDDLQKLLDSAEKQYLPSLGKRLYLLMRDIGPPQEVAVVIHKMGEVLLELEDCDKAIDHLSSGLDFIMRLGMIGREITSKVQQLLILAKERKSQKEKTDMLLSCPYHELTEHIRNHIETALADIRSGNVKRLREKRF